MSDAPDPAELTDPTEPALDWQEAIPWHDPAPAPADDAAPLGGDRRDGSAYDLPEEVKLALDIAWVTNRPLLVRGEPGSGKSSLAPYVCHRIEGAELFELVVTSRTTSEDFLWSFDAVARLSDAQADGARPPGEYVTQGPLWKAFEATTPSVVLIDEIDKADPDVPNGLLVPLGAGRFDVPLLQRSIEQERDGRVLIVITSNGERELPPAFVRRCITIDLPEPTSERLQRIAGLHLHPDGDVPEDDAVLFRDLADRLLALRAQMRSTDRRPSTAEYLDSVRACRDLGIRPGTPAWDRIEQVAWAKTAD